MTTTEQITSTAPGGSTDDVVIGTDARIVVDALGPNAVEQIRQHVDEASSGGNRFVWFTLGFIAALVAGVVSAVVFLAVSDRDDDGSIDLDVPSVEVQTP